MLGEIQSPTDETNDPTVSIDSIAGGDGDDVQNAVLGVASGAALAETCS